MWRTISLVVRNVLFTIVVPGLGGVWVPWWLVTRNGHSATVAAWAAVPVIAAGAALYVWCVWNFAAVGDGTPGLWDAPARVVASAATYFALSRNVMSAERARSSGAMSRMRRSSGVSSRGLAPVRPTISAIVNSRWGE